KHDGFLLRVSGEPRQHLIGLRRTVESIKKRRRKGRNEVAKQCAALANQSGERSCVCRQAHTLLVLDLINDTDRRTAFGIEEHRLDTQLVGKSGQLGVAFSRMAAGRDDQRRRPKSSVAPPGPAQCSVPSRESLARPQSTPQEGSKCYAVRKDSEKPR